MTDLAYLFNIGFSGSDLWQALWIGGIASLFASRQFRPWKVCVLAFAVDRMWPFMDMYFQGYEAATITGAMWGTFASIPQDMMFYVVRYLGILGLVFLGYNLRRMMHDRKRDPKKGSSKPSFFPY